MGWGVVGCCKTVHLDFKEVADLTWEGVGVAKPLAKPFTWTSNKLLADMGWEGGVGWGNNVH